MKERGEDKGVELSRQMVRSIAQCRALKYASNRRQLSRNNSVPKFIASELNVGLRQGKSNVIINDIITTNLLFK